MTSQNERSPQESQQPSGTLADDLVTRMAKATKLDTKEVSGYVNTLLDDLVGDILKTTARSKKSAKTIMDLIAAIDGKLTAQLSEVMHHPKFKKLEGTWRGLNYLVKNSDVGPERGIYVDMINTNKSELLEDFESSKEIDKDQSALFKKVYEKEFGTPGGNPYAAIIGDFEFSEHPEDVTLLQHLAYVGAAAYCPVISAASPELLGLGSFTELNSPRDIKTVFDMKKYVAWKSFRESDDARFVALTMPRVMARLPYGSKTRSIKQFKFEEVKIDKEGRAAALDHDDYCWMNSAYVYGQRLTASFSATGFCTQIRGAQNGGAVTGLPVHVYTSERGDEAIKCPTEIEIPSRREKELSDCGLLAINYYKNSDKAVFFGAQTVQEPKKYQDPAATENAAISARLPYVMACSRFTHYIAAMARDMIGSTKTVSEVESFINEWLNKNYVLVGGGSDEAKAERPLAAAKVEVKEISGKPGCYNAVVHLKPWLAMEELTVSMRMVARLPEKKS